VAAPSDPNLAAPAPIGVGLIGTGFMGRAHSHALHTLAHMVSPEPPRPRLVAICGRDAERTATAARRFGYERAVSDWRELLTDPAITLLDNGGPNDLHAAPTIAAAQAGRHVICEKPLGRDADEALETWRRVRATGVTHMCGFNYRFVPAIRLARDLIAAGELGEIRHVRMRYLQDWLRDPDAVASWRLRRSSAGSGAIGDLGSHIIDLTRFLAGEIATVSGVTRTFTGSRPGGEVDVDDGFAATIRLADGAIGTLEASRVCLGHKNSLQWEINGARGTLAFDLERLNELWIAQAGRAGDEGLRRRLVTEPDDPFMASWWPPGHVLGWEHTFVHELAHLFAAIAAGAGVAPDGADLRDGYRAAEVCDAIVASAERGSAQQVRYRDGETVPNSVSTRSSTVT
jgi:predicted dehydrogenase